MRQLESSLTSGRSAGFQVQPTSSGLLSIVDFIIIGDLDGEVLGLEFSLDWDAVSPVHYVVPNLGVPYTFSTGNGAATDLDIDNLRLPACKTSDDKQVYSFKLPDSPAGAPDVAIWVDGNVNIIS